jgi:EAL domain-containing protein (putative c-di-GMP-specific phosphodiesterase class I)
VAEGVENSDQMSFLKHLQCKYAQGFLFSQAVDAEAASQLLRNPAYCVDAPSYKGDLIAKTG